MKFENIIYEKEGGIVTITFNRPHRMNAVNHKVYMELLDAINEVKRDKTARVLITRGAGDRAYCAGADIGKDEEKLSYPEERNAAKFHSIYRDIMINVIMSFRNLPIPTIAMVNGVAIGVGFGIALGHDIRIGSERARFMVGWMRMGAIPAAGETWLLPRIVGLGRALELILTARFVDAEEAERIGILNRLVPAETLEKETMEFARSLANGPPFAQAIAKYRIYKDLANDLPAALDAAGLSQYMVLGTEDAVEGMAALREKREPHFKGV